MKLYGAMDFEVRSFDDRFKGGIGHYIEMDETKN